jgi:CheY-like chemotaxis protein
LAARTGKRELIEPTSGDKRFMRRDKEGKVKDSVDVGGSPAADRRSKSKTTVKPGHGGRRQVIGEESRREEEVTLRLWLRHQIHPAVIGRRRRRTVARDLMLPGSNGFDLIRELKSRVPRLLPRTMVMTAASQPTLQDLEDARLLRRPIRKPFDLNELVSEVLALPVRR